MDLSADRLYLERNPIRYADVPLYYTTAAKEPDEEGFLIRAEQMESGELRSEELQSVQTWNGVTGYGI